jgi:allantoate deiminase
LAGRVAAARGLEAKVSNRIGQPAIRFDDRVCAALEEACREADVAWRRMPSLAGHDAQVIGRLCPAAMLFVPSRGGFSHRPDEETQLAHIVSGTEVLARALFRLAYQP